MQIFFKKCLKTIKVQMQSRFTLTQLYFNIFIFKFDDVLIELQSILTYPEVEMSLVIEILKKMLDLIGN